MVYAGENFLSRIVIEPGRRSGKPCIRSTRITIGDILDYMAGGMTPAEIISDFPELTHEDIQAALAYAAKSQRSVKYA